MRVDVCLPDWAKHAAAKIGEALQLAPDEGEVCTLLFSLLHAVHMKYFCDGDRRRSALELAAHFTELADKLEARERH